MLAPSSSFQGPDGHVHFDPVLVRPCTARLLAAARRQPARTAQPAAALAADRRPVGRHPGAAPGHRAEDRTRARPRRHGGRTARRRPARQCPQTPERCVRRGHAAARRDRGARRRRQGRPGAARAADARRLRRRRVAHAAGDRRRHRTLQGRRQAGLCLGLQLRPAPVLPGRARHRGLAAPHGHGLRGRLRPLAQLLQGPVRARRRHRPCAARGQVQELRRALVVQCAVAGSAGSRGRAVRVAVAELDGWRRESPPAACRQRGAGHRIAARQPAGRRRRPGALGAGAEMGGRVEDARRGARTAHRARREARRRSNLPPGVARPLPGQPEAGPRRRCRGRDRGPGRDQRWPRTARPRGRSVDRRAGASGARGREHQGRGTARQFARRQRLRQRTRAPNWSSRARPASRWWCRWATSRPRAATGSPWPPTR